MKFYCEIAHYEKSSFVLLEFLLVWKKFWEEDWALGCKCMNFLNFSDIF